MQGAVCLLERALLAGVLCGVVYASTFFTRTLAQHVPHRAHLFIFQPLDLLAKTACALRVLADFSSILRQGLLDFAFGPMFGVDGYPPYFYLSYNCITRRRVSEPGFRRPRLPEEPTRVNINYFFGSKSVFTAVYDGLR